LLNAKILDEFPWGRKWPPPPGTDNLADETWKIRFGKETELSGYNDGFEQTSPVMSFLPNKLGLFDLGGNVGEWCEDWSTAQQIKRVRRGGSWNAPTRQGVLSSGRSLHEPNQTDGTFGFRIVVEMTAS
jgi:formylglycine-generating enzyme required for sulfatase activity